MGPVLGWWAAVAPAWSAPVAAAPVVGVMEEVARAMGRTVVIEHDRVRTAEVRLAWHGELPPMSRFEAAAQAVAQAGVEARLTPTQIVLDRANVPRRDDLETHAFAFAGSHEQIDAVWAAAGHDAIVGTAI